MHLSLTLTILAATATTVAGETWKDILTTMYGECGAKCAIADYREQGKCGDPGSESTTECYCDKFPSMVLGTGDFGPCIAKCGVDAAELDYLQWASDVDDLCGWDNLGDVGGEDDDDDDDGPTSTTASSSASPSPSASEDSEEPTPTPTVDTTGTGPEDEEASDTPSTTPGDATPTPTQDAANTVDSSRIAALAGVLALLGSLL
ncbi:hypothetical protein BDW75DRAFT_245725 [Aspergillus navahoensis]